MHRLICNLSIISAGTFALLLGCQSAWVQATIVNHQTTPVSLVEVNYPGGSFGVQSIPAGGSFRYRFHILETDKLSIDFTDASHHNHTVHGPELRPGQEGRLLIEIDPANRASFYPSLTAKR